MKFIVIASKLMMAWLIFCFVTLATLQEGAKAHYRVKHSKNEFANGRSHINGIENFWGYAKARLSQFHGIKREFFYLHLKETEFRYNVKVKNENLYKILLKLIRKNPM